MVKVGDAFVAVLAVHGLDFDIGLAYPAVLSFVVFRATVVGIVSGGSSACVLGVWRAVNMLVQ